MKQLQSALIVPLALIWSVALTSASAPHLLLQVKHGLWMFGDITKVTGDTVFPDTMKTLPGDRAQRLAEVRGMLSQPSRERECLTQASLEQRIFNAGENCKQTIVSNTPRLFERLTECQSKIGSFTQDTRQRLVISSSTNMTMSTHSVSTQRGKTMVVDAVETGHLANLNCGNVHTIEQLP